MSYRRVQKCKNNEKNRCRYHGKCPPDLSHQIANDQTRAYERPHTERVELG